MLEMEDDEYQSLDNFKKELVKSAKSQQLTVLFIETAISFQKLNHTVTHLISLLKY